MQLQHYFVGNTIFHRNKLCIADFLTVRIWLSIPILGFIRSDSGSEFIRLNFEAMESDEN